MDAKESERRRTMRPRQRRQIRFRHTPLPGLLFYEKFVAAGYFRSWCYYRRKIRLEHPPIWESAISHISVSHLASSLWYNSTVIYNVREALTHAPNTYFFMGDDDA